MPLQLSAESAARLLQLIELSLEINSEKRLDALVDLLIKRIPLVLGAARSTLFLHDPARRQLWSQIATGVMPLDEIRVPDTTGLSGYAFQHNTVLNVSDAYADPRFHPGIDERTGFRTTNILVIPIRDRAEQPIGVLEVMNKATEFDDRDEELCGLLAVQAGVAIENVRTFERLREEHDHLTTENRRLRSDLKSRHDFPNLVGMSTTFSAVLQRARQVAPTAATVLLTGESGTGKELIAQLIHYQGPRADRPFVAMNCGAVPGQLLESELFGYERGAFTGAVSRKLGLFEVAQGGTVFLDEIGDLAPELQGKLLRVLQEGEVRRLGATEARHLDVRVIAATNRSLRAMIQQGQYREDLYYRLNVVPIPLPPLRDRREDIPLLVNHFLHRYGKRHGRLGCQLDSQAMEYLLRYPFPGNVRELENAIERSVILAGSTLITTADLPPEIQEGAGLPQLDALPRTNEELKDAKRAARDEAQLRVERRFLVGLLRSAGGSVTQAAEQAGMNRSLLQQMLARHGLSAEDFHRRSTGAPPAESEES